MLAWPELLNETRTSELLGGRPSPRDSRDPRSAFERDYGRLLFSAPVRRMSSKAQVFPLEPNDYVRTRLTHSLEVSNVSRDLAWQAGRHLTNEGLAELSQDQVFQMATIAATCGLVHDLGNPPFGHAGELAISSWFEERTKEDPKIREFEKREPSLMADFCRFEGNAQTIRILTQLQPPIDAFSLDLTCGTLSACGKYLGCASEKDEKNRHEYSKPGCFRSEAALVQSVREATGTIGVRNPLTYLMEAADDMVYCTVDIEDSVKKGIVTWGEVEREMRADVHGSEVFQAAIDRAHAAVGTIAPQSRSEQQEAATAFRSASLAEMVPAVIEVFMLRYGEIMAGLYLGELVMDDECRARSLIGACKQLLKRTVYKSQSVLGLEILGRHVIHRLMDLFWEGVHDYDPSKSDVKSYGRKIYNLASPNYRAVFERRLARLDQDETYIKLQLVTDQIAGMTDAFACTIFRQLTQPPS